MAKLGPAEVSRGSCLSVKDVSLTVRTWPGSWWQRGRCQRHDKQILNDINVTVNTGQLVAFLGNSGSGKTSLLNTIASRHGGTVDGAVELEGKELTSQLFRDKCGYVIQADRLLGKLTVKETVLFTARLKYAGNIDMEIIEEKVERCLRKMSLLHIKNSLVGDAVSRGISGGEKRRLSVAVQLLQDPSLLLLDEPTTGLDSFTAHYLVETLASLAHYDNKMVVMTIHQPRSDIFRLLDTVGIMSGGSMVYYGPRQDLVSYFSGLGYPCPTFSNPLDYCVDVTSIDRRSLSSESKTSARIQDLMESYKNSEIYSRMNKLNESEQHTKYVEAENVVLFDDAQNKQTIEKNTKNHDDPLTRNAKRCFGFRRFWTLIGLHLERMYLELRRDLTMLSSRILTFPGYAAFMWIMCWHLDNSLRGIQERVGLFYQIVAVPCQVAIICATAMFPRLRSLYYRESQDGLYNCVHFLVAYFICTMPFNIIQSTLFSIWIYWGLGLYPESTRFLIHIAVCVLQMSCGEAQFISCLAWLNDANIAAAIATLLCTVSLLYASGFLKAFESMIAPLRYMTYVNHFKYSSEIIAINEFTGLKLECDVEERNCTVAGDDVLESLLPGSADRMGVDFGALIALLAGYYIVAVLVFWARGRRVLH